MSSYTLMEIDGAPVIAKVGGSERGRESEDPIGDIADARVIWLTGYQAHALGLQNNDEVAITLPDIGHTYTGVVKNYTGDAKIVDILPGPDAPPQSSGSLDLTTRQAETVAYPNPGVLREWHRNGIDPGKMDWRDIWWKYPRGRDAVYPVDIQMQR